MTTDLNVRFQSTRNPEAYFVYTISPTGQVRNIERENTNIEQHGMTLIGLSRTHITNPQVHQITYTLDDLFGGSLTTLGSYPILKVNDTYGTSVYCLNYVIKQIQPALIEPKHKKEGN